MANETHEDTITALGTYGERQKIFAELGGNPAMREWTYVQLMKRLNEIRESDGLPPHVIQADDREPLRVEDDED